MFQPDPDLTFTETATHEARARSGSVLASKIGQGTIQDRRVIVSITYDPLAHGPLSYFLPTPSGCRDSGTARPAGPGGAPLAFLSTTRVYELRTGLDFTKWFHLVWKGVIPLPPFKPETRNLKNLDFAETPLRDLNAVNTITNHKLI